MKYTYILSFIFGILLSGNGISQKIEKNKAVSSQELKEWINFLASDDMRGRANGSPEMLMATNWISGKFNEYGLKSIFIDAAFIQDYSFVRRQQTINEHNVVGIIEGSDPLLKDQYIILSAHFDHIGVRKNNTSDSIYNGADDNAAGTCTLLGIAKSLTQSGAKPGRTIVFASFSGEEAGIKGSRFFVANSPIPLNKYYANINFEMTGHSEFLGKNRYYMTGCKISNLDNLIGEYNIKTSWKLVDTIALAEQLFYSSDNIAFSRISASEGISRGIPGGTFATTALADYIHSARDEGKLFDYENMSDLVEYFSDMILWLSQNKGEVHFTDPSFVRIE